MSQYLLDKLLEEAQKSIEDEATLRRKARNKRKAERRARRERGKKGR
jgi:hypothetical protein